MFNRLTKKIFIISIISITICTLIVGWVSLSWSMKTLHQQFFKMSLNNYIGSNNNLTQFLNNIAESSNLISTNPALANTLVDSRFVPGTDQMLTSIISGLNLDVIGVTIYGKKNAYSSNQISGIPSLNVLLENPIIKGFVANPNKDSIWVSRYKETSLFYNNSLFYRNGVLSYILKIYSNPKKVIGYALVDVDIKTVFKFFDNQNKIFDGSSVYIIRDKTDVLPSPNNKFNDELSSVDLNKMQGISGHFISANRKKLILYDTIMNTGVKTVMAIPLKNAFAKSTEYISVLIMLIILFFIISVHIAYSLDRSITKPLMHIYYKMKSFK